MLPCSTCRVDCILINLLTIICESVNEQFTSTVEYLILIAVFCSLVTIYVAANARESNSITTKNEPHFASALARGKPDFSSYTDYFRES